MKLKPDLEAFNALISQETDVAYATAPGTWQGHNDKYERLLSSSSV